MMSEQPPARGRKARETDPGSHRGWGLVVLCAAFFVVVSDSTIVYTALPAIERDLEFSPGRVQWVIIVYALTSGGLLLLGGRCADLLGHRRVFIAGVGAFTGASLLCGLAWSSGVLVAARVIEGLGAAVMVPAALSLLMRTFPEGAERNKALGVWGSLGGIGATAGLLLGGPLTEGLGWPWIFFLNIPVGGAVLALAPRLLPDSRDPRHLSSLDIPGALTITLALLTLIYAVVEAPDVGWTAARTVALLGVAVALAGLFVLVERRATAPLVPLRIFRSRTLVGGNLVVLTAGMAVDGVLFTFTLFAQQVLGYSAVRFALAMAVMTVTSFVGVFVGQSLVTRVGPQRVAVAGMTLIGLGSVLLAQGTAGEAFIGVLILGLLVFGAGLGAAFVAAQIAALTGVAERDAGLASGVEETTFSIGNALGVALLSTIAISQPGPLTGTRVAFAGAAVIATLGGVAALTLLRQTRLRQERPID